MPELKPGRPLKLRSVKLKSGGGEIRMLPRRAGAEYDSAHVKREIGDLCGAMRGPIAGFAFVAWGASNGSIAHMSVSESSRMPSMMIPDFVRNRLLAAQIEKWTLDTIKDE